MNDGLRPVRDNVGADTEGTSPKPTQTPLRAKLYIFLMLVIPALFLALSIPIVRSKSFPSEASDPFLLNPDYAFNQMHVDCEVVIYGDSTALTGLDPTVVSRATGWKTCNIAQSQSIVEIVGMLALDTYLKNNAPPKFLVMQFAPETLSRGRNNVFWPEGLTLLLRKRSLLEALPTLLLHPVRAYQFAIWADKAKVDALINSPTDLGSTEALFRSHGGLLTLPKAAETHCLNNLEYAEPTAHWVRELREKYSNSGTRVLVNVSPLPDCSPIASEVATGVRNVTDNSLALFPIGLFCDLDRHLTLEGAERASLELAKQLLAN
jgi:hypothetical protein